MRFILFKTTFEYHSFKNCLDLGHCIFLYVILQVIGGALLVFTRSKTKMKGLLCLIYFANKCQIKESLPLCAVFAVNKRIFYVEISMTKELQYVCCLSQLLLLYLMDSKYHLCLVECISKHLIPVTNFNDTNVRFGTL